jgi:hypothetical protein
MKGKNMNKLGIKYGAAAELLLCQDNEVLLVLEAEHEALLLELVTVFNERTKPKEGFTLKQNGPEFVEYEGLFDLTPSSSLQVTVSQDMETGEAFVNVVYEDDGSYSEIADGVIDGSLFTEITQHKGGQR